VDHVFGIMEHDRRRRLAGLHFVSDQRVIEMRYYVANAPANVAPFLRYATICGAWDMTLR
jgi:hypothetical protein